MRRRTEALPRTYEVLLAVVPRHGKARRPCDFVAFREAPSQADFVDSRSQSADLLRVQQKKKSLAEKMASCASYDVILRSTQNLVSGHRHASNYVL